MSKVDKHAQICKSLNELYARKNADYGDSFGKSFTEYGLTMACIRLEDKLNRIKALRTREAQVSDESIADTLMDLANYSIMTLIEIDQSEPVKMNQTPDPERGDHDSHCLLYNCNCLCNTCARDNSHNPEDEACCDRHGFNQCEVITCPDYVKEGE